MTVLIDISVDLLQAFIHSSTSFSVTLVIWTFCMVRLPWGGMIMVPMVGLCSGFSSLFSERRGLHSGLIFTRFAFSWWWIISCSERISEIFVSCCFGRDSFFDSWVRLCHVPSLMRLKKLSSFDKGSALGVFGLWFILGFGTLGLVLWSGLLVLPILLR